jgi:phospholipase C
MLDPDSASFLEDATRGTLAPVSWIDPLFKDFNLAHAVSTTITRPRTCRQVRNSFYWSTTRWHRVHSGTKTLLLVVHDEHGGFHEHVSPPEAPTPIRRCLATTAFASQR